MTVIAALISDGIVYMGGDRGMGDESYITSPLTPKIAHNGSYLIGYANSRGTGQILHYIDLPTPDKKNLDKFMRTTFVKAIKREYYEYGVDIYDDNKGAADFLVGVNGRLFEISTNDWMVNEYDDYVATGSGGAFAIASLHTSSNWTNPERRIEKALECAARFSPTCSYPFDILYI